MAARHSNQLLDRKGLREQVMRLGPWNHEVEISDGATTRIWLEEAKRDAGKEIPLGSFHDPRQTVNSVLGTIFPHGLNGRSILDCACNCGGYLFAAKDLGAGRCYGFDVVERWIEQAKFLVKNRSGPSDLMRFEVMDIYDLPQRDPEPFDIAFFNGILARLPHPLLGLQIAASLTTGLLVLNTETKEGLPDGLLQIGIDPMETPIARQGLHWRPTGAEVLATMLRWLGFVDTQVVWWRRNVQPQQGRILMVASKVEGLLDALKSK